MNRDKLFRIKDFITPVKYFCGTDKKRKATTLRPDLYKKVTTQPNVFWYSSYKTNYTIVRPLIAFSRRTVTINCIFRRLPVYPDRSNSKLQYSRNRIRKQIIPAIKFLLNPKIERALFQFSEFYNRDIVLKNIKNL